MIFIIHIYLQIFNDFRYSNADFLDIHDFHNSHIDLFDFIILKLLIWISKILMIFVLSLWFFYDDPEFYDSHTDFYDFNWFSWFSRGVLEFSWFSWFSFVFLDLHDFCDSHIDLFSFHFFYLLPLLDFAFFYGMFFILFLVFTWLFFLKDLLKRIPVEHLEWPIIHVTLLM